MIRSAWRIATDAPAYEADDMTGAGAKLTGGRWNEKGVPVVYAAENRSLACLETIVHLNAGGLPLNRYLVEIAIPDSVWAAREEVDTTRLVGWDARPASRTSIGFGTEWARSGRRDCRNFRVWAGMMGEETPHGQTQGALHPRPASGPAAGWRGSQERV